MHIAYFQAEERTKKMSTKDQRGVEEQASQRNHQVVFAAMTCEEGLKVEGGGGCSQGSMNALVGVQQTQTHKSGCLPVIHCNLW